MTASNDLGISTAGREAQRRLDELEWVLESDYLSYLHPRVVASMKRLIARQRRLNTLP